MIDFFARCQVTMQIVRKTGRQIFIWKAQCAAACTMYAVHTRAR